MYRQQNPLRGAAGGVFLIFLALAIFAGGGHFFLTIFFIGLAFCSLLGSVSTFNPRGIYGGLQGFVWLFGLGILFLVGFWPWILVLCGISAILGALYSPITTGLIGAGILGAMSQQQPPQPIYQPYQQGYQSPPPPAQPPETYQEGGQQHPYPQQQPAYEQPQVQYPQAPEQELPPQQ